MPDMAQTFDVCIRGAGIVGRTLALLLARERLRVALVAPPQPRSPQKKDVRAYALNASSRAVLQSLRGIWDEEAVDELDHALQCAARAMEDDADDELVRAMASRTVARLALFSLEGDPSDGALRVWAENALPDHLQRFFGMRYSAPGECR